MNCKFDKAWQGACGKPADESGFCVEHRKFKCVSCGSPATRECEETMGGCVCGALLCDDCTHTTCQNGCNSGAARPDGYKAHCKLSDQKYAPWYITEEFLSDWKKERGITGDVELTCNS